MGSLAVLAKNAGVVVTGSDLKSYPPMSNQLEDLNVKVIPNYDVDQLQLKPDLFVIGNVMSRGMPIIEQMDIFTNNNDKLQIELDELDINTMTPLDALAKLDELKKKHGV